MQRLGYVCASCRRSVAVRGNVLPRISTRSNQTATNINNVIFQQKDRGQHKPKTFHPRKGLDTNKPKKNRTVPEKFPDSRDPRKTGPSFYNENTNFTAIHELEQLGAKLTQDSHLVGKVYREFEEYLKTHNVPRLVAVTVALQSHWFPRALIQALIKHHRTIEGLPSLAEALRMLVAHSIGNDKLWAEVMFEYIKTEFYEDAVDLWQYRLECQKDNPLRVERSKSQESWDSSFPENSTSDQSNTPHSSTTSIHYYPAAAAITAFTYSRKLLMLPTDLTDIMGFLTPNGEDLSTILPSNVEVGNILKEYGVDSRIMEATLATLHECRPYSGQNLAQYAYIFDRLFVAAGRGDLETVRRIHQESTMAIPEELKTRNYYINFINAFMQCGSREDGDLIWREMLNSGAIPTAKVWGSWLDGCAKAKDIKLFQQSWDRMVSEGITPDTICWTIRMSMLFLLGQPESAKLCLQYMVDNGVPITTVTINVAIEKLIQSGLHQDAFALMQWASNTGIELDTVTYNLILNSQSKRGDLEGVLVALENMSKARIPADIVTYGVILRGMYNNSDTPPDLKFLDTILDEMKAAGISPNIQFYNTIIHAMLNRFGDVRGAKYVLSLMPNDSWRASSVTSAIFIGHYSRKRDIAAIQEIWETMRQNNIAPDEVVYSSTVVAYAVAGMKSEMLELLDVMERTGKRITVVTYTWVLRSLVDMQDHETAREILKVMQAKRIDILGNKDLKAIIRRLKSVYINAEREAYGRGTY